jgi:hypothetical protein
MTGAPAFGAGAARIVAKLDISQSRTTIWTFLSHAARTGSFAFAIYPYDYLKVCSRSSYLLRHSTLGSCQDKGPEMFGGARQYLYAEG